MKLNLPSTWTQKKIKLLWLLTLLHIQKVNSGELLSNCLGNPLYNKIVNFTDSVNITNKQLFCCEYNYNSFSYASCSLSLPCPYNGSSLNLFPSFVYGQCSKVGQNRFCVMQKGEGYKSTFSLPGNLCGGIPGNVTSNNMVIGECPNLDVVRNTLSANSAFSWLCCSKEACTVPTNVSINNNTSTASTNCSPDQYGLICFQDGEEWSCTGNVGPNVENITDPIGSCLLQVSSNKTITTIISSPPDATSIPAGSSEGEKSIEKKSKILITIIGILGGILLAGVSYLGWKKYNNHKGEKNVIEEIQLQEQSSEIQLKEMTNEEEDNQTRLGMIIPDENSVRGEEIDRVTTS